MRLVERTVAPAFVALDATGVSFDLSQPRQKLLLLAFFRYASCPLCNLRVHQLITHYRSLNDRLEIVAVFQSSTEKIEQYVGMQGMPFTVLPDPEKNLYRLYRVETSWVGFGKAWTIKIAQVFDAVLKHRFLPGSVEGEFNRIPADFIIDTDNKIIKAYYGSDIGDHLPLGEIRTLIKSNEDRQ